MNNTEHRAASFTRARVHVFHFNVQIVSGDEHNENLGMTYETF